MLLLAGAGLCCAQVTTGVLAGRVVNGRREPQPGVTITIAQRPGALIHAHSGERGEFFLVLPYGEYRLSAPGTRDTSVYVAPLQTTDVELSIGTSDTPPREIRASAVEQTYAGPFTVQGLLLALEPATVSDPLDFSGLSSMRLPLLSQRAYSWTGVRYTFDGLDATDPYQPGRTVVFPNMQAVSDVVVRSGRDLGTSPAYGSEIAVFAAQPESAWHGVISTSDTGAVFASGNLPSAQTRAGLEQCEYFHWFTRDRLAAGVPIGRRADLLLSGTGQWASQSVPAVRSGNDLNSRLLFGNARGRVQLDDRNQLDGQFSGSRIDLSNWGVPAGLEALTGRRMSPSITAPSGFAGLGETDHLDFLQAGWTRQMPGPGRVGALEVRYGFSTAHLETRPQAQAAAQSGIDLMGGVVTGAPPLANLAVRTRQNLNAAYEPGEVRIAGRAHEFVVGGGWELANVRNRFSAPNDLNLITAGGAPAFVVELNTPLDSRSRIQSPFAYIRDRVAVAPGLTVDVVAVGDFARGSLPAQSSPAGSFAPVRRFPGRGDAIAWNSLSPRAGVAFSPPFWSGLVLRGSYARLYSPLAGRYLDFGNPNSLGGAQYQWIDRNGDGIYQPGEAGPLLLRFGGSWSSIDPSLRRPYADEFNVGAEVALPLRSSAGFRLFRRDDKDRVAAVNTGVPAGSFRAVNILDPGPDFVPGTFDDQVLTVYSQDPSTLGNDRYLLTNPAGLRNLNEGVVAEVGSRWRSIEAHASFMAMKSWGPTNPGNSVLENDPGVIGALFQDPNTSIHASGRSYFDRGFVGKVQLLARLPRALGGLEWANTADYFDGLPFARNLLVTGLPQGPFLAATTVRGSPEGGNRAEYVLNWNLRLSRTLRSRHGSVRLALDVLNVTNAANRVQEIDVSGPRFNERLPVAIETPRFLRFNAEYDF